MILFDTSVVIDARDGQSPWHDWAKRQIAKAVISEGAVVNTVVVAEASVRASDPDAVPEMLIQLGFTLLPLPISAAPPAARAFARYLQRVREDGRRVSSKTPLPDFLIGAHAEAEGMRLVTRDPTRVQTYFSSVRVITPDLAEA